MNRSETFIYLLSKKTWTDYEWEKQTGITRATFGNNRKNTGQTVKAKTLEVMAEVCGYHLTQTNAKDGVSPNDPKALFRRCQAYEALDQVDKAYQDAREVCKYNVNGTTIVWWICLSRRGGGHII